MSWPGIMSGVTCVAMLGAQLLLPLGGGLEAGCLLTGVHRLAIVFFGLVDGA